MNRTVDVKQKEKITKKTFFKKQKNQFLNCFYLFMDLILRFFYLFMDLILRF